MSATTTSPVFAGAPARPECICCGRPYGRRRVPSDPGPGLWDCLELVVCDQCWRLAGGTATIHAALAAEAPAIADPAIAAPAIEGPAIEGPATPVLVFDPAVEALLAGADRYDLLHPIDRLLVESGVRWEVLRHIAVPARMDLAGQVLAREAPAGTRAADSPRVWLAALEARIRAQSGPGAEFRYNAKRRRWWRIAHVLSCCADRERRPLTWVTQAEIAAAVGCSDRTVRRCVAWLRSEGLLWEIVPGCQLPRQSVPDGETPAERTERTRRLAEAIDSENAAITRARAELRAAATGNAVNTETDPILELLDGDLAALPEVPHELEPEPGRPEPGRPEPGRPEPGRPEPGRPEPGREAGAELGLVALAPVYELRMPRPETERTELAALAHSCLSDGEQLLRENAELRVHPDNAHLYDTVTAVYASGAHTVHPGERDTARYVDCGPLAGYLRHTPLGTDLHKHQIVRPPQVSEGKDLKSRSIHPVDNRPAPPDSDQRVPRNVGHAGDQGVRQSEAVRAAGWLLRSRLDPRLCDEVSLRWLAAQIRGSHLLDRHHWSWDDLADLLHGYPENPHLPHHIHHPRRWIRARIQRAHPALSPTKLRAIHEIERTSPHLRRRRQADAEQARRAAIAHRRAAIDACALCDELGWLHVSPGLPTVRCNHDPDTGGW